MKFRHWHFNDAYIAFWKKWRIAKSKTLTPRLKKTLKRALIIKKTLTTLIAKGGLQTSC